MFSKWKVVLYVHGITGGSGMQQAFRCFEGSCRRKEVQQCANERQVGGASKQERSVSEWKEGTTNGISGEWNNKRQQWLSRKENE
jgi:hypothetical protein